MQDIIYYNARVITLDKENTLASAFLIRDGKFAAVGENDDLLNITGCPKADLQGRTVIPGLIDSHGHLSALAQSMSYLDLSGCASVDEVIQNLSENADRFDEWIIGYGYDNTKFPDKKHPTKRELDKVCSTRPVFITHASGHIAAVNSLALKRLGYVGEDYKIPDGGKVLTVSENSKEPVGILEENAFLAPEKKRLIPKPSNDTLAVSIKKAQQYYASFGITTAQDAGIDKAMHRFYTDLASRGKLIIDIISYAVQGDTFELLPQGNPKMPFVNNYKLLGGKTWLDGSPQGKTAWLTQPYLIPPDGKDSSYCGYPTQDDSTLTEYFAECIRRSIQVNAHANGDAAADQFIRCYKTAMKILGSKADLRPVMVHAQTVRDDQLLQMKQTGILPTFFIDHIRFWGDYHYESVLGKERAERISPAGSAAKLKLSFTFHEDTPVKPPSQLAAVSAAVNRTTAKGRTLGATQRISVCEALRAVTINGAYQCFDENIKGSIETGKYADFAVLDKNPLEVPPESIDKIRVLKTVKQGNVIFEC